MTGRATPMRRLAASVGVTALTVGGMLMMGPAFADPDPEPATPENITNQAGSIIVHKHVKDADSTDGNPAGAPLTGVVFTVQEVLHGTASINLATAEGWGQAETIFTGAPPALPSGFTLGSAQELAPTDTNGIATFNSDHIGVFLVTEKDSGPNLVTEKAAPFWVAIPMPTSTGGWNYNVDVYPKNVLGELEEPTKVAGNEAVMIGDEFTWTISIDLPAMALPYDSFTIEDVLPTELSFVTWDSVSVGSTTLTTPAQYTVDSVTHKITFTSGPGGGLAVLDAATAPTTVTAVLRTKVNALPTDGIIKNKATITVNGTPKDADGTTNYGEIKLHKFSSANEASLAGAEFDLYDVDPATAGASPIASGTTNASGEISWTVWVGNDNVTSKNFWLVETKAPAGHVLPTNPVQQITVNAGTLTEGTYSANISNHKPTVPDLPLTGAQGTLLFGLVGLGLIGAGATVAGVRKVRMNR